MIEKIAQKGGEGGGNSIELLLLLLDLQENKPHLKLKRTKNINNSS